MTEEITVGSPVLCIGVWGETGREMPFRISEIEVPEYDKEHTVRSVIKNEHGTGIRLKEIVNPKFYFQDIKRKEEPTFDIKKFQLIKKKK